MALLILENRPLDAFVLVPPLTEAVDPAGEVVP
jgi:hypothetical protein